MSYARLRLFWGAVDLDVSSAYDSAERKPMGPDATASGGGVGLRSAHLMFSRTAPGSYVDDYAQCHFDFVNLTGGDPDDTWNTSDYTTMDNLLKAWWDNVKPDVTSSYKLLEIRWYRKGHGLTPPNPPEKVTSVNVAATSGSAELPPQVAMSVTFKTALRNRWGRTYVPGMVSSSLGSHGNFSAGYTDQIGSATDTLFAGAVAADFHPTVYSPTTDGAYTIESVQVDDLADVIRSRRWRNPTHRYVTP